MWYSQGLLVSLYSLLLSVYLSLYTLSYGMLVFQGALFLMRCWLDKNKASMASSCNSASIVVHLWSCNLFFNPLFFSFFIYEWVSVFFLRAWDVLKTYLDCLHCLPHEIPLFYSRCLCQTKTLNDVISILQLVIEGHIRVWYFFSPWKHLDLLG